MTALGIFLELLGKGAFSITVALLLKHKSETAGVPLVTTQDKCLELAMPKAKYHLMCWFPEPFCVFKFYFLKTEAV